MNDPVFQPPAFADHFNTTPPDTLYHYTGQPGLLGIVQERELRATKVQYMNDATEFALSLKLARELLELIAANSHHSSEKTAAKRLHDSISGLEDINIFAVCFCEKGDLLSQWRGYSGATSAYSIAFDTDQLMQIADQSQFTLGRCIYDASIQRTIIEQAIDYCIQNELTFPNNAKWGFHGPLADVLFRCGVFFKDASFKQEQEWRLISSAILFYDDKIQYRTGNSMIVPFYKLPIAIDGALPDRPPPSGPIGMLV